jgi:hypothetical protein
MACAPELKNKKIAVNMSLFMMVSGGKLSGRRRICRRGLIEGSPE